LIAGPHAVTEGFVLFQMGQKHRFTVA